MSSPNSGLWERRLSDSCGIVQRMRWPQRLRIGYLVAAVFSVLFTVTTVYETVDGARNGDVGTLIGSTGSVVLIACGSIMLFMFAGFSSIGLSRRIVPCRDSMFGPGIQIPMRRYLMLVVALLVGGATYGLTASVVWYLGDGPTLLPAARDNSGGASVMAICSGIAMAISAFLLTFRAPTVLSIYSSGIRRRTRRWRLFSIKTFDIFLPWDDIAEFVADELVVGSRFKIRNPVIRVVLRTPMLAEKLLPCDSEDRITVLAYLFVAEPNTVLATLQFLKDNPHQRNVMAQPDACELLRPPPLRERFRAARRMPGEGTLAPREAVEGSLHPRIVSEERRTTATREGAEG